MAVVPHPFALRELEPSDAARGFLHLLSQLTEAPPLTSSAFESLVTQRRQRGIFTVVIVDTTCDVVVATASLIVETKFIRGGSAVGHIEDVVVHGKYRRLGLGEAVVKHLVRLAGQHRCYKVILDCAEKSVRFYEKCGFTKCEVLRKDLAEEEQQRRMGGGETLVNFISHRELDHMEGPQADEAQRMKVDRMIDNFFAGIPTPDDPMKVALMKTKEEEQDLEDFELLKETVREQYRRKQEMKRLEDKRISRAMAARFDAPQKGQLRGTPAKRDGCDPVAVTAARTSAKIETAGLKGVPGQHVKHKDDDALEDVAAQLAQLKEQVRRLEEQLASKGKV